MTYIWDEKPKSEEWVNFKYPIKHGVEVQRPIYDAEEMDAWLEKLKVYYDVTTNSVQVYEWKEKAEKFDKLVAIKPSELLLKSMSEKREYMNKLEAIKMVCDALSFKYDFIEDIKEILEGEDLQNIGDKTQ